jgi:phytanoyl-CoA hydroxylase
MIQGSLSQEQARHYRNQGYLRLPNIYSRSETAEIRGLVDSESQKLADNALAIGSRAIKLYGLYDREPALMHRIITNQGLVGALESIIGPNIVFTKNRHNHATVNDHKGQPAEGLHRDILQQTRGLVTAVVYLEDSTVDNGATRIVPGSHDLPYVGVPQANGGGTWMHEHDEYEGMEEQALPVPVAEGGVLLFNGLVFHGVGENVSGGSRRSVTFGFRSVDELDFTPDLARQVLISGEYIYRGNDRT